MADYWKSQDRKYCDFCKCWIADNKPSRDFHENGKKHKDNVKKRLKNITKDSAKAFRETLKVDAAIKAMENAGMEAYRRDVERNATADLTSIAINKKLKEDNLAIASGSSEKVWHEAVTKDGKSYYWNTDTNATVWTAPPEGYLSLKEQKENQNKHLAKKYREVEIYNRTEALVQAQEQHQAKEEERSRLEREKLKARRVKDDTPPPVYAPLIEPGKTDPYGKWHTVQVAATEVDLQLPQQDFYYPECPVVVEPEPQVREFKEKIVERLDLDDESSSKGESSFKKRKILGGAKRNTRQRLDDD
ncbi:unnamed protein product [Ceutorhynchus assimilis]|uniref:WW domain-binding protein 4 n=1 Tax=Ceutorhynchus assimilis TaxID=467358 RepID=A0A9N9MQ28_9CUCU|nr:unnamed protein product [Ceutorhynchus assimilis]